jgi:AcrR family transcriptional regulator
MQEVETGLRERKRAETRKRIADAALDLASERGMEGATVEAISAAADVSPRTFFNYFESKDDALLGAPDPRELEELVETVVAASEGLSLREVAVRFFAERMRASLAAGGRHQERHDLLAQHPHLFAVAFRRMNDTQDAFADGLLRIAAERGAPASSDPAWAGVVVAAAAGAVRAAFKEWTVAETASADHIEERANALMTTAWENLT